MACAVTLMAAAGPDWRDGPSASVILVPDGDTLVLGNGDKVRLSGIQAPKLPQGRDFAAWPLAEAAQQALRQLVEGQTVTLKFGAVARDRHGRVLAQVFLGDGTWVQQALVAQGRARVYSFPDNRAGIAELLRTEAQARVDRRGLWANPFYAIRDAGDLEGLAAGEGTFEIVEGRVLSAAKAGALVYLNFGRAWKTDFTVTISPQAQKLLVDSGLDPLTLGDHLIRVRGVIGIEDGPRMAITHPEQIEVLASR